MSLFDLMKKMGDPAAIAQQAEMLMQAMQTNAQNSVVIAQSLADIGAYLAELNERLARMDPAELNERLVRMERAFLAAGVVRPAAPMLDAPQPEGPEPT